MLSPPSRLDAPRHFSLDIHYATHKLEVVSDVRRVVRYRNRKLYEPAERRFVTIGDLARTVAGGGKVEVIEADSGTDVTAKILSRAMAAGAVPPSTDALTRLLRAGSGAAETVADVVARVGGTRMAASMRRAAAPERLAETFAPLSRRVEDARREMERIVGGLVGKGHLTWEQGTHLREEIGGVFRESLADVLARVKDLGTRVTPGLTPELAGEIADLKVRIEQLEALARRAFPEPTREPANGQRKKKRGPTAASTRRTR